MSYNLTWLFGDLIAGITVALVLVPQSMSYANIAGLAPQFGLYSSFVGVVIYALFATSKDVTIGPVAVMSLQTATVIKKINETYPDRHYEAHMIASALASRTSLPVRVENTKMALLVIPTAVHS